MMGWSFLSFFFLWNRADAYGDLESVVVEDYLTTPGKLKER